MKNFLIGAIDFIIDKENNPVFIEVNSCPGAKLLRAASLTKPFELISQGVFSEIEKPIAAIVITRSQLDEGVIWKAKELSKYFPTKVCYLWEQDYSKDSYIDIDGNKFIPNVILYNKLVQSALTRESLISFNSEAALHITKDKGLSSFIVKNATKVLTPFTFEVYHRKDASRLIENLKRNLNNGLVIKPLFGFGGKGVHVFKEIPRNLPNFKSVRLFQNRIDMNLKNGKYWDVRAYVMNGEFCGAVSRTSESAVVNLTSGGNFFEVDEDIKTLVEHPSEEIAKAIEKVSKSFLK